MANFAVLNENNVVENVIVADNLEIAKSVTNKTCIELTENDRAGISWFYDGKTFIQPEPIKLEAEADEAKLLLGGN